MADIDDEVLDFAPQPTTTIAFTPAPTPSVTPPPIDRPETPPIPSKPTAAVTDNGSGLTGLFNITKEMYTKWALLNTDGVSYVENGLRTILFFLPGRFKDQELGTEFCACFHFQYLITK